MARETIDQLARRLAESLPQGVRAVRDDLEQNFRAILGSGLARLDLVTREEFDVQEAVLARTRAKLEALEKRMAALEAGKGPAGRVGTNPSARATTSGRTAAGKKSNVTKKAGAGKSTPKKSRKKKKTQAT